MKTFVIYIVLAFLALVIQATLFTGTKPDLVLILICFYSLKFGAIRGMTYGALTGLIIDTINGYILGPNILSKALGGFLATSIREKFFNWNLFLNTVLIIFLSILDSLVVYICLESFTAMSFTERSWTPSILEVVYTTVVGLILYPVWCRVYLRDKIST